MLDVHSTNLLKLDPEQAGPTLEKAEATWGSAQEGRPSSSTRFQKVTRAIASTDLSRVA